jgi:hypothetical protein
MQRSEKRIKYQLVFGKIYGFYIFDYSTLIIHIMSKEAINNQTINKSNNLKIIKELFLLLILILFFVITGNSQNIERSAISNAGNYSKKSNMSLSFTLGEIAIQTHQNNEFTFAQGFQQSNISVSTLIKDPEINYDVRIYPNPVKNWLSVQFDQNIQEKFYIKIFNLKGQLLKKKAISLPMDEINFGHYKNGEYILQINENRRIIKSYKVVKQ